jgi:hypothetical protein
MGQGAFHILFCLYRKLILCLWLCATSRTADDSRYMTKKRWSSVDSHFHDGARSIWLSVLPIKAAKTSVMAISNLSPRRLPKIHDQESLTLRWRSLSWCGREHFTVSFGDNGCENCVYDYLQPIAHEITQDTWPKTVDAQLTLILPWVYPQYAIIWFGVVHHSHWVCNLLSVFICFHLNHCIVV